MDRKTGELFDGVDLVIWLGLITFLFIGAFSPDSKHFTNFNNSTTEVTK